MPKTYATFNLKQSVYDYKEQTTVFNSTNTYALVGLRWEATAATSGKFAIGSHQEIRLDRTQQWGSGLLGY